MSLIKLESFDVDANSENRWDAHTGGPGIGTTTGGRTGRYGVFGNGECSLTQNVTAHDTYIIGGAFFASSAGGAWAASKILEFLDGSTSQVYVKIDAGLTISLYLGDGTLIETSVNTITRGGTWPYFIEFKAVIHNTAGSYELRVNDVVWLSGTGVDTNNGAGNQVTKVKVAVLGAHTVTCGWDDVYICDNQGSFNTDFLGSSFKIEVCRPNGAGNSTQFALGGSTPAATNYGSVSDTTPDDGVTFVSDSVIGDKDLYALSDLSTTAVTIAGVQTTLRAAKDIAGTRTICKVLRSAGADYDGAAFSPSTSFADYIEMNETDPATSARFLPAAINSLQAGAKVVS